MNILVAPDSFKHSMTSKEAGEAIFSGAKKAIPKIIGHLIPLSDGGEGFTECMVSSKKGRFVQVEVHDALMRKIVAKIGLIESETTAIIELAEAAGIELLKKEERNPLITTTFGVGELISKALDMNCKKLIIGLGGSATNDAGAGLAMALGIRFYDKDNQKIGFGGGELGKIQQIDFSDIDKRINSAEIIIASDVKNILYGPGGASLVFGPQKGADDKTALLLDRNLNHYSNLLEKLFKKDIGKIPGSGAAGGTSASLLAFFRTTIIPGFELIKEATKLESLIPACDLIVTGEGKMDGQTAMGKAPGEIARLGLKYKKPVIGFTGVLGDDYKRLYDIGFSEIRSICSSFSIEDSIRNGKLLLEKNSEEFFRSYFSQYGS